MNKIFKKLIANLMGYSVIVLVTFLFSLSSCKKDNSNEIKHVSTMDELTADDNFNFGTTTEGNVNVFAKDNQDSPIKGARINIYSKLPAEGGILLTSGFTDDEGLWSCDYPFADTLVELVVTTGYIGLPSETVVPLVQGSIDVILGGKFPAPQGTSSVVMKDANVAFFYLCNFDANGVPDCLAPPDDVIGNGLLADINAALPEYYPVPTNHPEYLATGNQTDIILLEEAEVWITFVHEGAGYKNALGFYTYDAANPPTSVSQIQTINIAFPNLSYEGSGGGLHAGNKINIGTYQAGTGIGWVLVANGWNNTGVSTSATKYYSEPNFNPESNPNLKQHNVSLYDAARELFVIGFEDLNRSGGDNDFNDAIYYVSSNPPEAIDTSDVPWVDPTVTDTDGDGVYDSVDDYPNDPLRAFNNYYPGKLQNGTLCFEDFWPSKGDYDFNDLVLLYNTNQITNANNLVVDIVSTYTIQAVGAGFKNGFGFQLGVNPSVVASVTGCNLQENIIDVASNGVEMNQNKATIIAFDNTYNLFPTISSGYINTSYENAYVNPQSVTVTVHFNTPQTTTAIGLPPYNPFLIVNKERGKEIHLPNYAPTSLADPSYFGTEDDTSIPGNGRYYKTQRNLPWAMHIPAEFKYPVEKKQIIKAHLMFDSWVLSSGSLFKDWYTNKNGYRNNTNLYTH